MAFLPLFAAGCAALQEKPAAPGSVELFNARGSVITQIESEAPQRALFRWRRLLEQGEEIDSLLVLSPTGAALFEAERTPDRFVLRLANGKVLEDDVARQRLLRETGWRIPLDEAAYWIRCQSHPDESTVERTNYLGVKRIEQSGWKIACTEYDEAGRPVNLRLENPHSVLLVSIEEWAN